MMRVTGRAKFRQRRSVLQSKPLNFRLRGYDVDSAQAYWDWLGPEGRAAETRFLKADMVFPLWYGALLLTGTLLAWRYLGQPSSLVLFVLPVVVTVLADWVENLVHLHVLSHYGEPIRAAEITLASWGTSVKLIFFWLSTALMALMAIMVIVRGSVA
jgi:hypothetical protein